MAEISRVTQHANPVSQFTPRPDDSPAEQGRIMGASAKRATPPARVAEKAVEGNAQGRRDPSRLLEHRSGIAMPPIQPMPRAEVLQRARTIGARPQRVTQQAASILRRRRGGAGAHIAELYLALSVLEGVEDGQRMPLLDEEFADAERFAELVWETEDPDELVDLLKSALPLGELGNPKELLAKIRGLGRDSSALMDLLAGLQGIPGRLEDREALCAVIKDEVHELASGSDLSGTREVSFFRLAHLAEDQSNPLEFLSTCVDVSTKEPTTWIELLRSILRGNPSGATTSETLKRTVHNLIRAMGVEMQAAIREAFNKERLKAVNAQLQLIYTLHSLVDDLHRLIGEVGRSIELQAAS
ncbi:hypothetical protein [Variovorax soli]|uniref:Uncharacterized protein n=1 Tax=Variovorax soli TaxID=376815 RepID=A0ABU1NER0_9BURK|nr:hypothetical protein [Variovorax soli]MDR6536945.1 hypothetical protein [Variovorax soli]